MQKWINVGQFAWASLHDFVYLGIWWVFVHFSIHKKTKTILQRIEALEDLHSDHKKRDAP